jgi:hypothetical protein
MSYPTPQSTSVGASGSSLWTPQHASELARYKKSVSQSTAAWASGWRIRLAKEVDFTPTQKAAYESDNDCVYVVWECRVPFVVLSRREEELLLMNFSACTYACTRAMYRSDRRNAFQLNNTGVGRHRIDCQPVMEGDGSGNLTYPNPGKCSATLGSSVGSAQLPPPVTSRTALVSLLRDVTQLSPVRLAVISQEAAWAADLSADECYTTVISRRISGIHPESCSGLQLSTSCQNAARSGFYSL